MGLLSRSALFLQRGSSWVQWGCLELTSKAPAGQGWDVMSAQEYFPSVLPRQAGLGASSHPLPPSWVLSGNTSPGAFGCLGGVQGGCGAGFSSCSARRGTGSWECSQHESAAILEPALLSCFSSEEHEQHPRDVGRSSEHGRVAKTETE